MNILLQSKANVEKLLKQKATMAGNVLDMVAEGEKAHGWLLGSMDNGYDLTIGFFNDKARYVVFKKRSGSKWEEGDVRTCLMTIGEYQSWASKPGSEFFDYVEREGGKSDGKILATAAGWHSPKRRYAFVYIPSAPGEVILAPSKTDIDRNFPS